MSNEAILRHSENSRQAKKWLWMLSLVTPVVPLLIAVLLLVTGNPFLAPLILGIQFVMIPLADALFGEDPYNPPDEAMAELEADPWYRSLLLVSVPLFVAGFLLSAHAAGSLGLPWWSFIALALGAGVASGAGLTVGHELGHKPNRIDQLFAKIVNALTGYAHFCIEHNRGHHVHVATPEDPASAKMGESVYRFALREIPGAAKRGWALERQRLEKKGLSFWHWRNDLLQGYALTFVAAIALIAAYGWIMLAFIAIHHTAGWLQLTFANYVEHYGLLRQRRADGRYEPCEPRHSWNTNHIVSNLMLFHLQRHSDHHANPLRPYQVLRNFDDLPRLPSGYPGSFVLASIPPLWFAVMDPKVMAWAGSDPERVNRLQ